MKFSRFNKSLPASSLVLAAIVTATFATLGCDPEVPDCCDNYVPESMALMSIRDPEISEQMCRATMGFDDKYNIFNTCYYKEVDRYIDAAIECCAPLLNPTTDRGVVPIGRTIHDLPYASFMFFLPSWVTHADQNPYTEYFAPANAYTWCLLNTNPRTFQCNLQQAKAFEKTLYDCCTNAGNTTCIQSMVFNGGKCPLETENCCVDLQDNESDGYISRGHCEEILLNTLQCVQTKEDACCYKVREDAWEEGDLTRTICKEIYQSTLGESCIDDDNKYDAYKNNP